MARAMRAVVSRDRAHEALVEILGKALNDKLRESIDAFGREAVSKGWDTEETRFTWQNYLATKFLDFVTEGECSLVLRCEELRREKIRAAKAKES